MRAPLWILPIVLGVLLLIYPQFSNDYSTNQNIQQALILSLLVSGLNLSLGYAGELALGQAASYAAGAYGAAYMSMHGHTDLLLELAVGAGAALVVGIVTGIPGLRLGSWSLAMTSFFLVLLIPDVISIFSTQTGGYNGLSTNTATLFGNALLPGGTDLYVVIGVVTLIWFAIMRNIAISRHGTALRVLKQSPVLASSMGISVFRMKLIAYALGAVPAGLAGVLFANLIGYISPTDFGFTLATTVLAASILGGSATVYGALIGGFILQFGLNATASYQQYSLVVTGAFLVIGGVLLSGGLIGLARDLCSRFGIKVPESHVPRAKKAASADMPELKGSRLDVAGVAKAFGGNKALDGVDLVAEPGRVTALIGPNGSGKTTLLNMICGFYKTDAGTIRLGD
ncbi:MAG TPA: ATP-binding cassette domain-containing protein, partial [Marmoricola sp.]|nr:ATP-binding cassette domain-containing protein [Marmoricola sp.]